MSFCNKCGQQQREGAKFCSKCGATLRNRSEVKIKVSSEPEKLQTKQAPPAEPVLHTPREQSKKEPLKPTPKQASATKKYLPWILCGVAIISLIVLLVTPLFSGNSSPTANETADAGNSVSAPEAEGDLIVDNPSVEPSIESMNGKVIKKIALITNGGNIDEGYNRECWNAIENYASCDHVWYRPSGQSTQAYVAAIDLAVSDGANVIVLPDSSFASALMEVMDAHPDVYFIAADISYLMTEDGEFLRPSENTACYSYFTDFSGYLAGYAAVKDGYRKLGFLGSYETFSYSYGYGFIIGADAAAAELGVHIDITYIGDASTSDEIETKMNRWYQNGTEVIFACGGDIYMSAVNAASKNGGKVIGSDVDRSDYSNCIITSAIKDIAATVDAALRIIDENRWKSGYFSFQDHCGLPTDADSWRFDHFTVAEYESRKAGLASFNYEVDELPAVSGYTTLINDHSDQSETDSTQSAQPSDEEMQNQAANQNAMPKNFMDVCAPYDYQNAEAITTVVMMAGENYANGFVQNYSSKGQILSNLGGRYREMSFTVGHVDGTNMCDYNVEIYLDGTYYNSYEVKATGMPFDVTVPVSGVKQIMIKWETDHRTYQDGCRLAFANIKIQ